MASNVPVREQIRRFLNAASDGNLPLDTTFPDGPKLPPANNPDILSLYSPDMEVQVNVSASLGNPVEGRKNTWERDGQEYWHIRCPKNAMDNPHWQDYMLRWSLVEHAEAIGMTGWDWANRCSRWVAFDFDALTGHAPGIGVDDDQLDAIRKAAFEIPYVQVRRSTRGGGYHLYVFFCEWHTQDDGSVVWLDRGVPSENHTVHQALARCILAKMSQEANFNFASAIDACGGNMWVWHRDANSKNEGLSIVDEHTAIFSPDSLPINWRDHMDVVTRKRTKIKIRGIPDSQDDDFDNFTSRRNIIPLEDSHNRDIERLGEAGFTTIWVPEYNLLQTHTRAFKQIMEEHPDDYVGFFDTLSEGNDKATPNAFAFPLPNGAWRVVRFSPGITEHPTWEQNGKDWTQCYFNTRPDLETAAKSMGGAKISGRGGFQFTELSVARRTAIALGADIDLPEHWNDRECRMKQDKDGGLVVMVKKHKSEKSPGDFWVEKRDWWERVYDVITDSREYDQYEYPEMDEYLRALVTPGGEFAGWAVKKTNKDSWDITPTQVVKLWLSKDKLSSQQQNEIMGMVYANRWDLVNMPFQPEFPGDRQWNFKSAQLRFMPAKLDDDELPYHPHWDRILDHVGRDLDDTLNDNTWARRYGIKTGRQYLQFWIASMIREPFEPLPYLFLYGDENSGKSILHEAIAKLMTQGAVCRADNPLKTPSEFNGELANAVLAVIEETNLQGKEGERARNRMKDWVTSEYIPIRRMRTDTYLQRNTLHFIQCSNDIHYCLVRHGDTRTTVLYVPALLGEEIPKTILLKELEKEAPHFMNTLMELEIPPTNGRLRIPCIATSSKERMEHESLNSLMKFIDERAHYIPGALILFSEFYDEFQKWLPEEECSYWTHRRVSKTLTGTQKFPTGQSKDKGDTYIGNISWDPRTQEEEELGFYNRRLRPKSVIKEMRDNE